MLRMPVPDQCYWLLGCIVLSDVDQKPAIRCDGVLLTTADYARSAACDSGFKQRSPCSDLQGCPAHRKGIRHELPIGTWAWRR